jgi:hypothetical protein
LLTNWRRTISIEIKRWIDLINVHVLRPVSVIKGEPIGAIDLGLVHLCVIAFTGSHTKGNHVHGS